MVSIAQIRRIAPNASSAIAGAIVSHWHMAEAAGINSPLRAAHFLARVAVETGGFRSLVESLHYTSAARIRKIWPRRFKTDAAAAPYVRNAEKLANFVYANRMGNGPPSSGDGWRFRGGGMMQTTGREGFRRMGFEENP
jgi:predicted chitinase